jgi:hypothetical protein
VKEQQNEQVDTRRWMRLLQRCLETQCAHRFRVKKGDGDTHLCDLINPTMVEVDTKAARVLISRGVSDRGTIKTMGKND